MIDLGAMGTFATHHAKRSSVDKIIFRENITETFLVSTI